MSQGYDNTIGNRKLRGSVGGCYGDGLRSVQI
jgi:hypothetical protein